MAIGLPALPYALNALEPFLSGRTLEFHHDKHHAAYVNNANKMVAGTDLAVTITRNNVRHMARWMQAPGEVPIEVVHSALDLSETEYRRHGRASRRLGIHCLDGRQQHHHHQTGCKQQSAQPKTIE